MCNHEWFYQADIHTNFYYLYELLSSIILWSWIFGMNSIWIWRAIAIQQHVLSYGFIKHISIQILINYLIWISSGGVHVGEIRFRKHLSKPYRSHFPLCKFGQQEKVVLDTSLGHKMFWVRVVHNPTNITLRNWKQNRYSSNSSQTLMILNYGSARAFGYL